MLIDHIGENIKDNYKNILDIPSIDNREFWDSFPTDLKEELIKEGKRQKELPWSQILVSDYREVYINGNRVNYEDKCFMRRIKLSALTMAECVQNKGEFVSDILDGIYLIMEESSWCHPAHNSHIRDAKQKNIPDIIEPVIDLFAAETGAVVSLCEFILRPVLQKINTDIEKQIDRSIRERLLIPYLNEHFWWMGDDETEAINWTVWITQNILLSFFTRNEEFLSSDEKESVIKQAVISTDYFIKSYGEDGCCDEGAQYYTHAGLCLFGVMELLDDLNYGRYTPAFSDEKIRNIASYIRKIYVGDGYYINFADCAAKAGNRSAREFLFGLRCGDVSLCSFVAEDYRRQTFDEKLIKDEHNLWYRILQAQNHKKMMEYETADKNGMSDIYYESVGLMVSRNETYVLAAKAGDNNDSHNHNDVGSVTLYKNNKPFLIDLGVETYTAKTFSERRYEIWTMRSLYHNVPSFVGNEGEIEELPGEKYRASNVIYNEKEQSLDMEIASAFADHNIKSYRRKAKLYQDRVVIDDHYEGNIVGYLNYITYEKPQITTEDAKKGEVILSVGNLGTITVKTDSSQNLDETEYKTQIETLKITDERLKKSWDKDCYRIRIPFAQGQITTEIK